jgi:hypothetical protein
MKKEVELLPPIMPNFININTKSAFELLDFSKRKGMAVVDLTKEEAEKYGELMKQTFIQHWSKKQLNK